MWPAGGTHVTHSAQLLWCAAEYANSKSGEVAGTVFVNIIQRERWCNSLTWLQGISSSGTWRRVTLTPSRKTATWQASSEVGWGQIVLCTLPHWCYGQSRHWTARRRFIPATGRLFLVIATKAVMCIVLVQRWLLTAIWLFVGITTVDQRENLCQTEWSSSTPGSRPFCIDRSLRSAVCIEI